MHAVKTSKEWMKTDRKNLAHDHLISTEKIISTEAKLKFGI